MTEFILGAGCLCSITVVLGIATVLVAAREFAKAYWQ